MKVARTLTIWLGLVALVVMAGLTMVLVLAELTYLGDDMESDHRAIMSVLDTAIAAQWPERQAEARAMLVSLERNGLSVTLHGPEVPPELTEAQRRALDASGFTSAEREGYRWSWSRVPVSEPTWLELRESVASHYQWVRGVLATVLVSAVALLATFLLVALVTGRRLIGQPVERLVAFAQRVGAGDFSARSDIDIPNELGELGRQLDSMAGALASAQARVQAQEAEKHLAEERLHHAERLTTVGKLAAGIAHELGTPLSVVGTWGRMLASGEAVAEEARKGGAIIAGQADAMSRIIRQLVDFARLRTPERAETDLETLLDATVTLVGTLASQRGVTLLHRRSGPRCAAVDAMQIQQVLTNLAMNAVQSMRSGGVVSLEVVEEERPAPPDVDPNGAARRWVVIHVVDQGVGMSKAIVDRIFEPFFTTKDVGEGSGLGLSVSWSIVRDHGGWISVTSVEGAGSDFAVYLPRDR